MVVIEDLISTGGSSIKAAEAVRAAGATPLVVLAIFSYQLDKGVKAFEEAGIQLKTLSNYTALMNVALAQGTIQESDFELLKSWREDPSSFGK